MAFKRKFWKRGDKLNAKELNRIEEGIANSGSGTSNSSSNNSTLLTFNIIDNGGTYTAENFSLEVSDILEAINNYHNIKVVGIRNKSEDEIISTYFYLAEYTIFDSGFAALFFDLQKQYELTIGIEDSEEIFEFQYDAH